MLNLLGFQKRDESIYDLHPKTILSFMSFFHPPVFPFFFFSFLNSDIFRIFIKIKGIYVYRKLIDRLPLNFKWKSQLWALKLIEKNCDSYLTKLTSKKGPNRSNSYEMQILPQN